MQFVLNLKVSCILLKFGYIIYKLIVSVMVDSFIKSKGNTMEIFSNWVKKSLRVSVAGVIIAFSASVFLPYTEAMEKEESDEQVRISLIDSNLELSIFSHVFDKCLSENVYKRIKKAANYNKDEYRSYKYYFEIDSTEHVSSVNLIKTFLTDFPIEVTCLRVVELNISDNYYIRDKGLPASLGNMATLTKLDLVDSRFEKLPESFFNLTNLTYLSLSDNPIQDLPEGLGNLIKLKKLFLHNTKLQRVPDSIGKLTNLVVLDFFVESGGDNDHYEDYGGKCGALRYREFRDERDSGQCSMLFYKHKHASGWAWGDYKGNYRDHDLYGVDGEYKDLDWLWASCNNKSNNAFTYLPESFGNLIKLKKLDLALHKSLTCLPTTFGNLINLTYLNVAYTNVSGCLDSLIKFNKLEYFNGACCEPLYQELEWNREVRGRLLYKSNQSILQDFFPYVKEIIEKKVIL